jgi:ParB family chromosome partitioning protein
MVRNWEHSMSEPHATSGKRRRLGKGLHAIVGHSPVAVHTEQSTTSKRGHTSPPGEPAGQSAPAVAQGVAASHAEGPAEVAIDLVDPGRHQPRTRFDDAALASLADSIRAVGVIQPIVVRPAAGGRYELIAGERRLRASKLAGLASIPAVVREVGEREAAEAALIENLQREDLNPIERAEGLRGLIERFGLTQQEIAARVGLERSSVANLLRLLELEGEIRGLLETGLLGLGHGKALLSAVPGPGRVALAARAVREGWSVRRLQAQAKAGAVKQAPAARPERPAEERDLERRLGQHLGTRVRLRAGRGGKGAVTIAFYNLDHFDDLMSRIGFRYEETE